MRQTVEADAGAVAVDLVRLAAAVGNAARKADLVVAGLGLNCGDDAVHRVDAVEVVGGDDHRAIGVLQGGREAAADHVTEDVEDHHVGVFQKVMLFQKLDGLADDIAAAAGAGWGAASLHTFHAVEAGGDVILGAEFFGVEVDLLEDVDDRGLQAAREGEGGIMLRVAADLQHAFAHHGKRGREVRRGGGLADAALAVDGEDLGTVDADAGVEGDLDGAFAVKSAEVRNFVARAHLGPLSM